MPQTYKIRLTGQERRTVNGVTSFKVVRHNARTCFLILNSGRGKIQSTGFNMRFIQEINPV